MKDIGVIFCCYGNPENIEPVLFPWFNLKNELNIKIAAVQGQFLEYHNLGYKDNDFETQFKLMKFFTQKKIDHVYFQNPLGQSEFLIYQTEAQIRNKGLEWLKNQNCDIFWFLDSDEFYTEQQIKNIIEFVSSTEYCSYYICFKNYFGDGKKYFDNFCPIRVFRNKWSGHSLGQMFYDNDFYYINNYSLQNVSYKNLPYVEIPKEIAWVKHNSWVGKENCINKIKYHVSHFGESSYTWNAEKDCLDFNYDYYKKYNKEIPIIHED